MKTTIPETTVGIDLGDKKHAICAIGSEGKVIDQRLAEIRQGLCLLKPADWTVSLASFL